MWKALSSARFDVFIAEVSMHLTVLINTVICYRSRDTSHWKTFSIESLYSLSPASVARDITNDLLADLKQVWALL